MKDKKWWIDLLMFMGFAFILGACAGTRPATLEEAVQTEANKLFKHKLTHGLVIGILKDDRVHVQGFGAVDLHVAKAPDRDTLYQIGSLTKLFTVATYQVLCDEGALAPDDTLADLIGDDVPLSPSVAGITLDQLASHRSGLPRIPRSLAQSEMSFHDPEHGPNRDDILSYLVSADGVKRPGKFRYSNYGMGLLGHVMELKTGRPLDELVFEHVLSPLGMVSSGFGRPPHGDAVLATGYFPDDEAVGFLPFTALGGAGAMYSTMGDLMLFAQANFDPVSPLHTSLVAMQTPLPAKQGAKGWLEPGFLEKAAGNKGALWHNGSVGGFASYISIDPERRIAVVMLSNKTMDLAAPGVVLTKQARQLDWENQQ